MGKQKQLEETIATLHGAVPDITGVVIASADGLVLASDLPEEQSARVAAMAATASGLGSRITQTLNLSDLEELTVRGGGGFMFVYRVGPYGALGVVAKQGCNVGLVHLEARQAVQKLAGLFAAGS